MYLSPLAPMGTAEGEAYPESEAMWRDPVLTAFPNTAGRVCVGCYRNGGHRTKYGTSIAGAREQCH